MFWKIFILLLIVFFFFSSRRRHTRYWRDWSSDVCSSDLLLGRLDRGVDILDQLDLRLLDEAVQVLDVGLVEVDLGKGVSNLGVRQHAGLLALGEEELDLLELLKFRYRHPVPITLEWGRASR